MRTVTVATAASVLVIAGGVVVERKWSAADVNPTAAALASIPTSHSAVLLETQRQQMIMVDSMSKNVRLVGAPAVAQIQVAAPKPASNSSSGSGNAPTLTFAPANPGSAQAIAQQMMPSFGFSVSAQWGCLDSLWQRESSWVYNAENASGAYGIPQALPGSKMASAGSDWLTNPATQIRWGLGYIQSVYGTPCGAWDHEEADGWY
jgi:resuscitation-promoting factor RpfB